MPIFPLSKFPVAVFAAVNVHVALFLFLDFSVDQFFIALFQLQFLPFAFFPVNRLPSPIGCTVLLPT